MREYCTRLVHVALLLRFRDSNDPSFYSDCNLYQASDPSNWLGCTTGTCQGLFRVVTQSVEAKGPHRGRAFCSSFTILVLLLLSAKVQWSSWQTTP